MAFSSNCPVGDKWDHRRIYVCYKYQQTNRYVSFTLEFSQSEEDNVIFYVVLQIQLLHGHLFGNVSPVVVSTYKSVGTGWLHIGQLHKYDFSHFVQHILHLQTIPTDQTESTEWHSTGKDIFRRIAGHGNRLYGVTGKKKNILSLHLMDWQIFYLGFCRKEFWRNRLLFICWSVLYLRL